MKLKTTKVFKKVDKSIRDGFTTISAQGSSRSGKTYNILIWLIIYSLKNNNTRISIVRKTLPSIRGSVLIDFKDILIDLGLYDARQYNKSEFTYRFLNGSWVEFFSADNEQKLRGRKRDILYVNEANELSFLEMEQLRMRTSKLIIMDYNPSFSDEHWICEANKDAETFHFITTYKDNPFLSRRIINELESLQNKNKSLWQIYGLGMQAVIEGLIFKNVDEVAEIPSYVKHRFCGVDYGFTNDPTAIVEVGIAGNDVYIDEVAYRTEMLPRDIIDAFRPYRHLKIDSESADPRLVKEIHRAGFNIHSVVKGSGSIISGISKMLEYNIHVTKKSYNVMKEFKNYTYAQDREGKWLNQPIDAYNHAIDASRYVFMSEVMGGTRNRIDKKRTNRIVH